MLRAAALGVCLALAAAAPTHAAPEEPRLCHDAGL